MTVRHDAALFSWEQVDRFLADTPLALALETALRITNPNASWSGAAAYVTAGGQIGRIDALLAELHRQGAVGLTYEALHREAGRVPRHAGQVTAE